MKNNGFFCVKCLIISMLYLNRLSYLYDNNKIYVIICNFKLKLFNLIYFFMDYFKYI